MPHPFLHKACAPETASHLMQFGVNLFFTFFAVDRARAISRVVKIPA